MHKSLRIGIDARLLTYQRGMGTYVHQLVTELAKTSTQHEFMLYVDDPKAANSIKYDERFTLRILRPRFYPLWEQVSLPRAAIQDQLDLLHCPANTAPLTLPSTTKLVMTIHDVMYMMSTKTLPISPSWYQRFGRLYRRLIVPWASRHAALITTDSQQSSDDIGIYLGNLPAPVIVVQLAATPAFQQMSEQRVVQVKSTYTPNGQFVLALGGIDPRKNTERVIAAFAQLFHQMSGNYQLVIVGLPSVSHTHYKTIAHKLGVEQAVIITDFISEEDLIALYNLAEVFLYPSLYEGFGFPVLEAMACGTPVVTTSTGSLAEVAGDAALMVDPLSVESIANGLRKVLTNAALAQRLKKMGLAQAQRFSWSHTAQTMLDLYERVML